MPEPKLATGNLAAQIIHFYRGEPAELDPDMMRLLHESREYATHRNQATLVKLVETMGELLATHGITDDSTTALVLLVARALPYRERCQEIYETRESILLIGSLYTAFQRWEVPDVIYHDKAILARLPELALSAAKLEHRGDFEIWLGRQDRAMGNSADRTPRQELFPWGQVWRWELVGTPYYQDP